MESILITGTSTGIGRATALMLDRNCFRVFATVRRQEDGDSLKENSSGRIIPVIADLSDEASIKNAFTFISSSVGEQGLRGLVNNAGVNLEGPLEFFALSSIRKGLEVNLIGPIILIQTFLPLLRKCSSPRIVNVGSIGGVQSPPFVSPYAASKGGLHAFTVSLRRELLPFGIHVSLVIPGNIRTPIWNKITERVKRFSDDYPAEAVALYGGAFSAFQKTTERMATRGIPPERVARAVAHALAKKRPKTRYIVGLDAKLQSFAARWVPDRIQDQVLLRVLGIQL
jgi:NAD(P)-dependent dehydrogenase (short-subunit alcohol dehydrogenase family)